ncbi:MAG: nuclear transport factor 2 family protein [Candidatus Rokuibacteriota bacterium]
MTERRHPYVFSEAPVFDGGTQRDRDELTDFYHRLRRANDALDGEQLREVWSADPDSILFNTNGHAYYGLEDWLKIWAFYGPRLKRGQPGATGRVRIVIRGDLAVIVDDHLSRSLQWPDEAPRPAFVTPYYRATIVCRRENGAWKGWHAHYSSGQIGPRPEQIG